MGEDEEATEEDTLDNECDHDVAFSHTFLQKGYNNPNWILLDTGSSIYVFGNPRLLADIHKLAQSTKIH